MDSISNRSSMLRTSTETSAPNILRQQKQVPIASQFLLLNCNISKTLNVSSMWFVLLVFVRSFAKMISGGIITLLFTTELTIRDAFTDLAAACCLSSIVRTLKKHYHKIVWSLHILDKDILL